ncbi:hypothetical protein HYU92_05230 [Candidatus Curtissbacteria bacterium]|nr:hypothetical protein [Candidatus Curtissbacteria bacterium]
MLQLSLMPFPDQAKDLDPDGRYWGHPMMWWGGGNQVTYTLFSILWLITWILVVIVLIALARWLWKKGDKGR